MPSSHLILGHPLLPLPSVSPSIRVFSESLCVKGAKSQLCTAAASGGASVQVLCNHYQVQQQLKHAQHRLSLLCPAGAAIRLFSRCIKSPSHQTPYKLQLFASLCPGSILLCISDTFAVSRCSLVFSEIVCFLVVLLLFILKDILQYLLPRPFARKKSRRGRFPANSLNICCLLAPIILIQKSSASPLVQCFLFPKLFFFFFILFF